MPGDPKMYSNVGFKMENFGVSKHSTSQLDLPCSLCICYVSNMIMSYDDASECESIYKLMSTNLNSESSLMCYDLNLNLQFNLTL